MIRIVIADSQNLFRISFAKILCDMRNVQVVGIASNGEEALTLARSQKPDILMMDIVLPGMGGIEATQRISRMDCRTSVIAVTACIQTPFPAQMLKAGALGFLTKNVDQTELEVAIRRVFAGKRYVCGEVAQDLASYAYEDNVDSPFELLSNREMQIMLMVVSCQKVSDISNSLHLSPKTVNSYRYRIFDKLNISSDVELVLLAVRYGMINQFQARSVGQPIACARQDMQVSASIAS